MKKYLVAISLFVFWTLVVAILVAGLISRESGNQISSMTNPEVNTPDATNKNVSGGSSLTLTSYELAKHNSLQSCWLLISGKIYDVTSYIRSHPGGSGEILANCGTDATATFASRGGTGSHSSSAQAMLGNYYMGDFNQTVTTNLSNPGSPQISNPPFISSASRGDDNDEDDD